MSVKSSLDPIQSPFFPWFPRFLGPTFQRVVVKPSPGPRAQVQIELHRAQVSRQPVGAIQALGGRMGGKLLGGSSHLVSGLQPWF